MSHFTKIKTKILDKDCLLEVLENLNYKVEQQVLIKGYEGLKTPGDIVIKTGKKYDIGFVLTEDGSYDIVADWYGAAAAIGKNESEFAAEINQKYSLQKVIKTVKRKGFQIRMQKQVEETGEIKLVVVKRGASR